MIRAPGVRRGSPNVAAQARHRSDPALKEARVDRVYWYLDGERSGRVKMRIDDPDTAGHLVIHLDTSSGPSRADIETFREKASPDFVLRAAGQPDVPAHHERGGWIDPGNDVADFYLRVAPADFARMEKNVAYALVALGSDDAEYRCAVNPGVTITRRSPTGP